MSSSSNDLLADRRIAWAQGLMDEGDHAAAADLLGQVVDRVPAWAPGWAKLAEACERSGDRAGARGAWERVAALDPGEKFAAAAHLARLAGRTPPVLPGGYVRALFDDYAERFEGHLVGTLAYRGPAVLAEALERGAPGRHFARALDLGCGTGLMGRALRARAERIDGVDLSPAMIERARATGIYDGLTAGSLEGLLTGCPAGTYDLVVAADVLVYVGDLVPVFAGAARAMAPGGLLAFTAQSLAEGVDFALGLDMRFSHAADYVGATLRRAGFDRLILDSAWARRENGMDVPGLVGLAARRG